MLKFFITNWPWLTVFIAMSGGILVQLAKDEMDAATKTKLNIFSFILGIVGAIGGLVHTYKNEAAQARLQSTVDSSKLELAHTKDLTKLNVELSNQIKLLSEINNLVARRTQNFASEGKNLIRRNLITSNNINSLTSNARSMVDKIYDNQFGGNSIPIITATTFEDRKPKGSENHMKFFLRVPTNTYRLFLILQNTGDYKLSDVSVISYKAQYRMPDEIDVLHSGDLLPRDSFKIKDEKLADLIPDVDDLNEQQNYTLPGMSDYDEGISLKLRIHWRNITYYYNYKVLGDGTPNLYLKDDYSYKGKTYNKEQLIKTILSEQLFEKKRN